MINFRDYLPRFEYPKLAEHEQVVAQAAVSRGLALLTDRRLVVANGQGERSVALSAVGAVEVGYRHMPSAVLRGAGLIALAAVLFAIAAPVAGFLAANAGSLESFLRNEATADAAAGILWVLQKGVAFVAGVARWLPLLAWICLIWGLVRIGFALRGRTAVNVLTVVGEYELAHPGRSAPLDELGRELSRRVGNTRGNALV